MKKEIIPSESDPSNDLPGDSGFFKVPEGYFEALPDSITSRAIHEPVVRQMPFLKIGYRVAAVLAFLAVGLLVYRKMANPNQEPQMADITIEELSNSTYAMDLDEYVIASHVPIHTVGDSGQSGEIVEYLLNNQIDANQISQEL